MLTRRTHPDSPLTKDNIYVLEKAREVGQHCLSGALLDPESMRELLPGFEKEAPLDAEVTQESVWYLTATGQRKFPIVPPPLRDHGNYIISLNKFVKWMGQKVEEAGITIFTGFAGSQLLWDGGNGDVATARVTGVQTDDKGVDKEGQPKGNFEPGYDLRAKVTVLAEGTRGNCAKELIGRLGLEDPNHAQTYGLGIKELWEIPAGRIAKGEVRYTLGYPLTTREYGGAWVYGISDTLISVGYVTGLDYEDPRTDPHHVFQSFKEHPWARRILEGGKMIRYGAKSLPYGGWLTMPQIYGNGWVLLGDSASFLNSQRLKGIHLAIKSGMLAAEAVFDALLTGDSSEKTLRQYKALVDASWIRDEMWRVRNFHQGFEHGLLEGLASAAVQQVMFGARLGPDATNAADYRRMARVDDLGPPDLNRRADDRQRARGREADVRPADGCVSLGHAARRGSAGPPGGGGSEHLQRPMHAGIRKSLPVLLPGSGVRDGGGGGRKRRRALSDTRRTCRTRLEEGAADQLHQLRALQDLRHHGPLPDHQLGAARGRRRSELRRDVEAVGPVAEGQGNQ